MINSCEQCKSVCCKTGPGPYKKVRPDTYVKNFGEPQAYNTKCLELVKGKCKAWGTNRLPSDCRRYICHVRKYSKEEIDFIKKITGDYCPKCKAKYAIQIGRNKFQCEVCGRIF